MYKFQQKLKRIKERIEKWNQDEYGNIFVDKKILETRLEEIQNTGMNSSYTSDLQEEEARLCTKIQERERQEEILWHRKSRVRWIKEGE